MIFFSNKKCKVIIKNINITVEVKYGANLYNVLIENNISVPSLCKGSGQCGKCKVRITSADGKPINKPSKKDSIILAPISIDAGFRLACQYEVKSDIIIDISEFQKGNDIDSDIVAVKKKGSVVKSEDHSSPVQKETISKESPVDNSKSKKVKIENEEIEDLLKPQVIKITPRKKQESEEKTEELPGPQEDLKYEAIKAEESYDPVESIILIQYPNGVKYFTYSPSLDNVSGEGFIKGKEKLLQLISDNSLLDFMYNATSAKNTERILIIDDEKSSDGDILLNLINYKSLDINGVFCEIISPHNNPKSLLTFLRLISNSKNGTLNIPLDNLADCHFNLEGKLIHLNGKYVVEDIKISEFLNIGKNPIIDTSADLSEIVTKDKLIPPDSMLFTTFMKIVSNLKVLGIVDNKFNLKSRAELIDKIPLELLVKLSFRNEQKLFNVFRSKDVNIYISQQELNSLNHLRVFINSLCNFVEKNCGKLDNITFHTLFPMEALVNELINIGIIPQKYSKKSKHIYGDPSVQSIKLFSFKNIPDFVKNEFGEEFSFFDLYKNEDFNAFSKIFEKEFFSKD
jgi:ferredoxin